MKAYVIKNKEVLVDFVCKYKNYTEHKSGQAGEKERIKRVLFNGGGACG